MDCNNCPKVMTLEKEVENLKEEVKELKMDVRSMDSRLMVEERASGVRDTQIKTIFNILTEIKDSIKVIANKMDQLDEVPKNNYNNVKMYIVGALISTTMAGILAGIGFILTKIIK